MHMRNVKTYIFSFILVDLLYMFAAIPAKADYVLPYPSYMPGNKLYKVSRIVDSLKKYWYFGSIAQIKYRLALSDKYLVEAKTLMEYGQYLLASDALVRSDASFQVLPEDIQKARQDGKDVSNFVDTVREAGIKHEQVIQTLEFSMPKDVVWSPEKEKPTELKITESLVASEKIREQVIDAILK